ncbi:sporulation integral membrane protein YtvI [Herbinix hemicellulosilytica]|uniref:Putative membrane protein n=1 Tax=Herbinix hemicellulosilytica TaxID=1564487 RepID=A0A0H5SFG5_HERHM|nr:sporulation integral membrane protein YtvI [Herbinix hemicellulosilytica]RBP60302.1 sporulation integral membrane protein YtvI [Herbinix hemicellulosilytica]CRZ33556.1 putative membrane protein [Herbinix hemicellulosilytica]
MNIEKQKAFILHVIYIVFILGLGYIAIKYILPLLMPFVIGLIIAILFRQVIDYIEKKIRIKRSFVSIFILIIFYGILAFIISIIGAKAFTFLKELFGQLPDLYRNTIEPALDKAATNLINQFPDIKPYVEDFLLNISDTIFSYVKNASATVISKITGLAGKVPSLLIKLIFTIVSSFFFTIDYYKISDFLMRQFNGNSRDMILRLKDKGLGTIGKFIKAYTAILSITFAELSLGFLVLGIPNPFLFGAMIALIDIMPILGTGAVLLPWSIIALILGNTKIGIGMFILYIVITAVRQTIEPKIVGGQIGLHPIITLVLMYVGAKLMGVLGLLLLPVIATIVKTLNDEGTIKLFK